MIGILEQNIESGIIPPPTSIYDDAFAVYSLRKIFSNWTNAVLEIRRSSDNAVATVFFDTNGKISTTSLVSTTSDFTTPSSPDVTLSTWIGASDGFTRVWVNQQADNTYDVLDQMLQATTTLQPQLISSGTIITKNGEPTIDFLSTTKWLKKQSSTIYDELDSGNDFTVLTVSNNIVASSNGGVLSTSVNPFTSGTFNIYNGRATNRRIIAIRNTTGTSYLLALLSQQNISDQRIVSSVKISSSFNGYFNGTIQDSLSWAGSYLNNTLTFGILNSADNALKGTIQEVIIFPTDKSSDLTELHDDINNYYNIY